MKRTKLLFLLLTTIMSLFSLDSLAYVKPDDCLCFTTEEAGNEIAFKNKGQFTFPSFVYSTDGSQWHDYTIGNVISLPNVGDKVYFMAKDKNGRTAPNNYYYIYFTSTKKIAASGNVMSLLDNTCQQTSLEQMYGLMKLFFNCTHLTKAPKLPATKLDSYCYSDMFAGCTSLTEAPELPATTLAACCYYDMFLGCTGLTKAPKLPATTLAANCYTDMFDGCTSLTKAPKLPATTLAELCYYYMFKGCTSLTEAPELPATTLANFCYACMFKGCTSLTKAPNLPATTLAENCYAYMFDGCNNLNSISVNFTNWEPENATNRWVDNVASTGNFYCPKELAKTLSISNIPSGWSVYNPVSGLTKPDDCLCFTTEEAGNEIAFVRVGSHSYPKLVYSSNGTDWFEYTIGDVISIPNVGDKVYFMAQDINVRMSWDTREYIHFTATKKIGASGNAMSLLDKTCKRTYAPDHAFACLFLDCVNLTSAPKLPATTVYAGGYANMFKGCTGLTEAPELPVISLNERCYLGMFEGCTSLKKAPKLPATTLASGCYRLMFTGCTSLTTAPELPAITLAEACYSNMFKGCTSLTKAPALPATTLADYCYSSMFNGCTSLTTTPELPATTLAESCYSSMFNTCTSLTTTPELPATILAESCYSSMFNACTSLTTAPALPATSLASWCYSYMFEGCTSLTTAPELPATTLAESCYYSMFNNCNNLNSISVNFTKWVPSDATNYWVVNVASKGTFYCPSDLPITRGTAKIPAGWTIITHLNLTKPAECLAFTTEEAGNEVGFTINGTLSATPKLVYSTNGTFWYEYEFDKKISLPNVGDKVYFMALDKNDTFSSSKDNYIAFSATKKVAASGSIMSLLDNTCQTTVLPASVFANLFKNCTTLTTAPDLPAPVLTENCYYQMFYGCKNLNSVTVGFTEWKKISFGSTRSWLLNVASSGTFYCPDDLDTSTRSTSNIPEGWTVKPLKKSILDLVNLIKRLKDNSSTEKISDINTLVNTILGK